jgi:aminoglycoside/choline kinase family phosphotransferase
LNTLTNSPSTRETARKTFLECCGWGNSECIALEPDASFRRYFQLAAGDRAAMLMEAPPEHEKIEPFLDISSHLQQLGLRVPEIYFSDLDAGYILLEDLGNDTLTSLLDEGGNEADLYQRAMASICELQTHPQATAINPGEYDAEVFIGEAMLMIDWYLPATLGRTLESEALSSYVAAWGEVFAALPELEPTLVLRDFHVDNLILVDGQCALLDYQDALIGSPAYDVVSLLEDARRNVGSETIEKSLQTYLDHFTELDPRAFNHHYQVWGAQRHAKVLGIFVRLWLRDNKPIYLKHLPRVWSMLVENLEAPQLEPVKRWMDNRRISLEFQDIGQNRNELLERLGLAGKTL